MLISARVPSHHDRRSVNIFENLDRKIIGSTTWTYYFLLNPQTHCLDPKADFVCSFKIAGNKNLHFLSETLQSLL